MVSNASEDLPEPDGPVITVNARRGISRSKPLRLCCLAPRTMIRSFMAAKASERSAPKKRRKTSRLPQEPANDQEDHRAERRDGDVPKIEIAVIDLAPPEPRADQAADE